MRGLVLCALMLLPACGAREVDRADAIIQPAVEPLVDPVVQLPGVQPPVAEAQPAPVVTAERAELERAARALGGRLSPEGVIEPPLQDAVPMLAGTATRPDAATADLRRGPEAVAVPKVEEDQASLPEPTQSEATLEEPVVAEPPVEAPVAEPVAEAVAQPAAQAEVPWLQQYQAAYAARQIALSDVTTQVSYPQLGVYVEDFRTAGAAVGTPHQTWLTGSELQVVSPALESLLLSENTARFGAPQVFSCDASVYACRTVQTATEGAYFRFAVLGEPQLVRLVGVLYYDPTERGAAISTRIDAFNRVIDAQLPR